MDKITTCNNIICDKLGVSLEQISPDKDLQKDLGADSLDMVELIMEFENHFSIRIPDTDSEKIKTVKDIMDYIEVHTE